MITEIYFIKNSTINTDNDISTILKNNEIIFSQSLSLYSFSLSLTLPSFSFSDNYKVSTGFTHTMASHAPGTASVSPSRGIAQGRYIFLAVYSSSCGIYDFSLKEA